MQRVVGGWTIFKIIGPIVIAYCAIILIVAFRLSENRIPRPMVLAAMTMAIGFTLGWVGHIVFLIEYGQR